MPTKEFGCYGKVVSVINAKGQKSMVVTYLDIVGGMSGQPVYLKPDDAGLIMLSECAQEKVTAFVFFAPGEHEHVVSAVFKDGSGLLRKMVPDKEPSLAVLKEAFKPSYIQ